MAIGPSGKLVLGFVTLLLGAVLISTIATNTLGVTTYDVATNEAVAITGDSSDGGSVNTTENLQLTYRPTGWEIQDCPLSSVTVRNGSDGTALTVDTDYEINLNYGNFTLKNTTASIGVLGADNNTYVTYSYCASDYMNLSWGRTLLNLIAGFFALALLGAAVGLFYSVGKDTGII